MDLIQLGVIINNIELYNLKLVKLTLTLIQGHRSARKQKFRHKFSVDLD